MKKRRYWWTLGLFLLTGIAMMASARTDMAPPLAAEGAVQARPSAPVVGSVAPALHLTTIDGQQYSSATLRGKVVILFAMFASCADCIPQGQTLSQVQQTYSSKGVTVLGVDIVPEESVQALRQYLRVGHITIPLAAYTAAVVQPYQLVQPDMTYVIGRDGIVKYKNMQSRSYADFQRELDALR